MKMKTSGFLGAFAALALAFAPHAVKADLIYWMVADDVTFSEATNKSGDPVDYTYATISADGGSTHLTAYNQSGPLVDHDVLDSGASAAYFGSFDDSVTSFLVELWFEDAETGAAERVGWQSYSAASLADSIWKGDNTVGSGASYFTVSSVIPEPSSGLMLLLGGALLALRRRRAAC